MKPRGGEGQNGRLKCPLGFLVISSCVHIFIHQERRDELLIRRYHQGEESGDELSGYIREFFEKILLLIRQCNTCLEEIMMVTKQNY